ncbi:DUF4190 domain-containing protein [Micromonospora costi]|uniref:DUF4190 domain-containing protein n=1 Tax=Micromonospora costi TaxID=1530042 RepID=A0A3A9ZXZ3_9ACTN|nr:DUF4190 domain-containing protein [Micromonospora costi]RKN52057.1 DUF4190 domain-containing protein [Micromonospora costi]
MSPPRSGAVATASLWLGVAALPLLFVCALGLPCGLAAIATGVVALARGPRVPGVVGRAAVGVALGVLALVGGIVLISRPDG